VELHWRFARFDDLTPREVHDIFRARIEAFVIEQNCLYQDIDGADPQCWHLLGRLEARGARHENARHEKLTGAELVAYCRVVPPGVKFLEPSIGRVVTTAEVRGTGLGRDLMREAVARTEALWPARAIRIGAQSHLERFYNDFGFVRASEPYLEDGIPHIEMIRR